MTPAQRRADALRRARVPARTVAKPATPAIVDALQQSQKTLDAMLGVNKKTVELLSKGMITKLG